MTLSTASATLHTLTNADGSATYTSPNGATTIIVGVNYPVEVPYRSDEIPESTFIEVNLRPHNGIGMVKERHVELLVGRTLQALILGEETPRTMLQVTLQVLEVETDESLPGGVKQGGQGESYLDVLTEAINASILGCLDAAVQMETIAGAILIGIEFDGNLISSPNVQRQRNCQSLHCFAFTSKGRPILIESEGHFRIEEWQAAQELGRRLVLGPGTALDGDVEMNGTETEKPADTILNMMRRAVENNVVKHERWH